MQLIELIMIIID